MAKVIYYWVDGTTSTYEYIDRHTVISPKHDGNGWIFNFYTCEYTYYDEETGVNKTVEERLQPGDTIGTLCDTWELYENSLYEPEEAYTVSFDFNGGTSSTHPTSIAGTASNPCAIPNAPPTREGYIFIGWLWVEMDYYYYPGETIDVACTYLVAQWQKVLPAIFFKTQSGWKSARLMRKSQDGWNDVDFRLKTKNGWT